MENDLVSFRLPALLTAALAIIALGLLPGLAEAAPPSANPPSLTFTKETVGRTSGTQTITISKTDAGIAQLGIVSILGTDPADFLIAGENCAGATLSQGDACAMEVAFSPGASGPREATIEVAVEGEAAIAILLAGTGETMRLTVPGAVSFPNISVGGASTRQVALKNESEVGVNVSEVNFEGVDAGDFGIEGNNCNGFIGPGMGCELTVRFSPSADGAREGRLRVVTNGAPSEYFTELTGEGAPANLTFEPASHDFGLVEMHSNSPRTNFTLRNTGTASVQLSNLQITGPDTNEFFIPGGNCPGATLAPGDACSLEVQFNANNEGSFAAAVSVQAGGATFQAPLSGRAESPKVEASPAPLAFGPTSVGSRQVKEVTLTNAGDLPVGFYIAIVSGGDVGSFHILEENCTSNVFAGHPRIFEPGESCAAKVAFEPSDIGAKAATVSFFGGGEGALQVSVEGTAVAPQLNLSPSSRDFGAVAVGVTGPTQTFELRSGSGDAQTIDSATVAGADLGEFQIRSDDCGETTLDPGASCAVTVRFDPESKGAKTATLRLHGPGGTTVAQLSGEGAAAAPGAAAPTAKASSPRGRLALDLMLRPRPTGDGVTIGRARCASSDPCVLKLRGLVSGRIATASGRRALVRGLPVSKLKLAPGASAAITIALPREFRGSFSGARLQVSLHWRTGSERGASVRSFRLGRAPR